MTSKQNDEWPKRLIMPTAKDFAYGTWCPDDVLLAGSAKGSIRAMREHATYECGSTFCMVGWVGAAFNGPHMPSQTFTVSLSAPHREFVSAMIEFAGRHPREDLETRVVGRDSVLLWQLSHIFECDLTPEDAEELWKKTAKKFGYE